MPASQVRRTAVVRIPALTLLALLALIAPLAAAEGQEPVQKPRAGGTRDTLRVPRVPADSGNRSPVDTTAVKPGTGTGGASGPKGGAPGPAATTGVEGAARYRVTLNGFTVLRQSYDDPLQLDGKGDEVYVASWVAVVDTGSPNLVSHQVLQSRVMGDRNGYASRVRAGSASALGGVRTGDRYPQPSPWLRRGAPAGDSLPMVLFEGTLFPFRSAVVLTPTVWEWDHNPELFGYWVVSRGAMLDRLTEPAMLLAAINNSGWGPLDLGSPGLEVQTNMFADPRDRPIGLELGKAAATAEFATPQPAPRDGGTSIAAAVIRSAAATILRFTRLAGPLVDRYAPILSKIVASARTTSEKLEHFGEPRATILPWDGRDAAEARSAFQRVKDSLRVLNGGSRARYVTGASALGIVAQRVRPVVRDYTATKLYFFEKTLALTPQAIAGALAQASTSGGRPRGSIDIPYADHGPLQGRYILHLQVERIP